MALLFDSDRLEHGIGVGIAGRPLVAVGDLDLLGGLHPGDHRLHRSEASLQALKKRELHGRRIRHRLPKVAEPLLYPFAMRRLSVRDGADDLGSTRIAKALGESHVHLARLHLSMPGLEQPIDRLTRRGFPDHAIRLRQPLGALEQVGRCLLIDRGADHHSHALHRVVLDALEVPALVQGLRVAGRVDGPSAQLILPRSRRVPG